MILLAVKFSSESFGFTEPFHTVQTINCKKGSQHFKIYSAGASSVEPSSAPSVGAGAEPPPHTALSSSSVA